MELKVNFDTAMIEKIIVRAVDEYLHENINRIVEKRLPVILKEKVSERYLKQVVRDNISRIMLEQDLKKIILEVDTEEVTKNIEQKMMLMLKNSNEFKTLVRGMLIKSFKL